MPTSDPADYLAATEYLFGLKPAGTKYGVDRMALLAAVLAAATSWGAEPARTTTIIAIVNSTRVRSSGILKMLAKAAIIRSAAEELAAD